MSLGVLDLGYGPKELILKLREDVYIPKGYLNQVLVSLVVWEILEKNPN